MLYVSFLNTAGIILFSCTTALHLHPIQKCSLEKNKSSYLKVRCVQFIHSQAYLHYAMADGTILPLPQKHQTDHNHSCYGHGDHQQTNQCTAAEAEVLSQGAVGPLKGRLDNG